LRKLVVLVVVLAVLAGALSIVDVVARERVQTAVAARIESRSPGSHAVVSISSFPFLGYLAASGTVPALRADVSGVEVGSLRIETVDLRVRDLKVSRSKLVHRQIQVLSIREGSVVAKVSQSALDAFSHVPVTIGRGTVGVAGVDIPAQVTVSKAAVTVSVAHGLATIRVPVPDLDILPCVGTAQLVPGALELSCTFRSLPGFLAGATFHS
jgi:hypothetical protein